MSKLVRLLVLVGILVAPALGQGALPYQFQPQVVYQNGVDALQRWIDAQNIERVRLYRAAHAAWVENYKLVGYNRERVERFFPLPKPPKALAFASAPVFPDYPPVVESDVLACEELPVPERPSSDPAPGAVVFGPRLEGLSFEAYYAAGSDGPIGRTADKNGAKCVLEQIGRKGTIVYVLYWRCN